MDHFYWIFFCLVICGLGPPKPVSAFSLSLDPILSRGVTPMNVHSDYTLTCSATDLASTNVLELVLYNVTSYQPNGHSSSDQNLVFVSDGVYKIANQPPRYVVTKSTTGSTFTMNLEVTGSQPEDSGYWVCRVSDSATQSVMVERAAINLRVIEQIVDAGLATRQIQNENMTGPTEWVDNTVGEPITIMENDNNIQYKVVFTTGSVQPQICICLGRITEAGITQSPMNITDEFQLFVTTNTLIMDNQLIHVTAEYSFTSFTGATQMAKYQNHNKSLIINASQPEVELYKSLSYPIYILFEPKDLYCPRAGAAEGTTNATMTCTVKAYPEPTVEWKVVDQDGATSPLMTDVVIKNSYNFEGVFTTSLHFPEVTDEYHTSYQVTVTNMYGSAYETNQFTAEDPASDSTMQQLSCHIFGFSLMLAMILI